MQVACCTACSVHYMQVACYPGCGTDYIAHVDNGDGDGRVHDFGRVLTLVYYLNDLGPGDGGALRLHLLPEVAKNEPSIAAAVGSSNVACYSSAVDVTPRAGTFVVFRSDRVVHEVRQCTGRHRYALTVWILAKAKVERYDVHRS